MMNYDDREGKSPVDFNKVHENEQKLASNGGAGVKALLSGQQPTSKEINEGAKYIYVPNVGNVKVPNK
jgi:hypothetical protein